MKRRIIITESQFDRVIQYRTREIQNKEVLEEGPKEWVLAAGLMTLASLAGLSQTKKENLKPEDIRKAELVQNKLKSGDKEILNVFDSTAIAKNEENLEKLKNLDIEDASVDVFKTTSKTAVKSHLDQGYVLRDIKVYSDTILKKGDSVFMSDTMSLDLKSDAAFKTGKFDLTDEYKQELTNTINDIVNNNGKITEITIESSTDREPIKMGNEKLAQLRSNAIKEFLDSLGYVKSANIKVQPPLPNQGPNIYSKTMSDTDRKKAREITAEYRYVRVTIDYEVEVVVSNPQTIEEVVESYRYEMIKGSPNQDISTYKFKGKSVEPKKLKQPKCKKVKINNNLTDCPIFDVK